MTLGDGRDVTVTGQSMLRWEGLAFGCGAQVDRHEFSWMHIAHIVTAYKLAQSMVAADGFAQPPRL